MLDSTGDAKRSNYSREDDSARRLWLTQRTKANPWDHRASNPEEDDTRSPQVREIAARAPEQAVPNLIAQTDRLSLEAGYNQPMENPFAKLILSRLNGDV